MAISETKTGLKKFPSRSPDLLGYQEKISFLSMIKLDVNERLNENKIKTGYVRKAIGDQGRKGD